MLTLTCALELRAALERATLLTSQQNARSLVEQVLRGQSLCTVSGSACSAAVTSPSVIITSRSNSHSNEPMQQEAKQHTGAEVRNSDGVCVLQARKPLSALRTFGAMLQLRVARSDPSSDMAAGVVIQVSARACCSCYLQRA